MSTLQLLFDGLAQAANLPNFLATMVGVLIGLAVGALPALGPSAGVAILLPAIVNLNPTVAIAGLAGVYYGAMYGGGVTSILIGVPGDSASMMTCLDGYPLAKRGEAGRALGMTVYSSFFGGLIALVLMTFLSREIASQALAFGTAEMAALMVLGLCMVTVLGGENRYKGFASLGLGLWIGSIGIDPIDGNARYTLGSMELLDGIDFIVVIIGLYGLAQMLEALAETVEVGDKRPTYSFNSLLPNFGDILLSKWVILVSSLIGFFVGCIPGTGATAATIFSYAAAKRMSKTPEKFGTGMIEGVAGPEAANNATSYAAMIPLFTLGIPSSATSAVMLGGLMMLGLQPGPLLFRDHPDFIWTLIGTFYIGNVVLVFLTIALVPALAALVFVRMAILFPVVVGIVMFGVFSLESQMFDIAMSIVLGVFGYLLSKAKYPLLPVLLGVILGPYLEQNIRRSMIASAGSLDIYTHSPLAMTILIVAALIVILPVVFAKIKANKRAVETLAP